MMPADDDHTYFIIRIPCHPEFVCDELRMDEKGHILPVGAIGRMLLMLQTMSLRMTLMLQRMSLMSQRMALRVALRGQRLRKDVVKYCV